MTLDPFLSDFFAFAKAGKGLAARRPYLYWVWADLACLLLSAGPVLLPNFLGSVLLLFCSSFSAYATASAINSSLPLVTNRIASVLSGNVLAGQQNLGAALALDGIFQANQCTTGTADGGLLSESSTMRT